MTAMDGRFSRRRRRAGAAAARIADLALGGAAPPSNVALERVRYLRVAFFFARVFLSFLGWDLVLRRLPGFRGKARSSSLARWRGHARRYRRLAVELGGVLIKLGQFLSIRVDVLPQEVTSELRGLQDEVPPESLADIQAVVASEFGKPVTEVFAWFSPVPEAAASLAQVHRARLADPQDPTKAGEEVVVKVQRPRIEQLVATDLAALRLAIQWLKLYRPITRRVDLDRLYKEFADTSLAELDFAAEARNAERFADNFADDPGIYIADVFWEHTTRRVLTLENVASIKIDDVKAMEAAGIRRAEVARRLYDCYLEQLFIHSFVHADPHPGNLFVHPLDRDPSAPPDAPRPFLLIFVDFGMVAVIPEGLRASLREFAIGIGTRDAHRVVQAYLDSGVLLPGADRKRLEELHEILFARLGGVKMAQLGSAAMQQAQFVLREYRDIIFEMPFQVPADILFAVRAVALLAGIATTLDPTFDPWEATLPFAQRLASDEMVRNWRGVLDEVGELARLALRLPARLDRLITQAERGELVAQSSLAPDHARSLHQLQRAVDRLTWGMIAAGLLISGAILRAAEGPSGLSTVLFGGAALAFLVGLSRR